MTIQIYDWAEDGGNRRMLDKGSKITMTFQDDFKKYFDQASDTAECIGALGFESDDLLLCRIYPSERKITIENSMKADLGEFDPIAWKLFDIVNPPSESPNGKSKPIKTEMHNNK